MKIQEKLLYGLNLFQVNSLQMILLTVLNMNIGCWLDFYGF